MKIQKIDVVKKALHDLGEHFESVQILATFVEEGQTLRSFSGCGNWYARQGMAHEFINQEWRRTLPLKLPKKIKPEDEP